jgi:hypothetical protein
MVHKVGYDNPSMAVPKQLGSWNWTFHDGNSLHAEVSNDRDGDAIIIINWILWNGEKTQELHLFLDDGAECLESLAHFVAAQQRRLLAGEEPFGRRQFPKPDCG